MAAQRSGCGPDGPGSTPWTFQNHVLAVFDIHAGSFRASLQTLLLFAHTRTHIHTHTHTHMHTHTYTHTHTHTHTHTLADDICSRGRITKLKLRASSSHSGFQCCDGLESSPSLLCDQQPRSHSEPRKETTQGKEHSWSDAEEESGHQASAVYSCPPC